MQNAQPPIFNILLFFKLLSSDIGFLFYFFLLWKNMQIDLLFSNQTNNFKLLFSQLNFFLESMAQCLIDVGYKSFCLDK